MSSSRSANTTQTTTRNQPVTLGGDGQLFSLSDLDNSGEINISSSDPAVITAALETVERIAQGTQATTAQLAQGSNRIAAQVADSQRDFLATQTGETFTKTLAIVAVAGVLAFFIIRRK